MEFSSRCARPWKKDASRPPCGCTTPQTIFFLMLFLFLISLSYEWLWWLLIRLGGRPNRFRRHCGRSAAARRPPRRRTAPSSAAPGTHRSRAQYGGRKGSGESTAHRVHHCTRPRHADCRHSLLARDGRCGRCRLLLPLPRCQVHQRSPPLVTYAALAPGAHRCGVDSCCPWSPSRCLLASLDDLRTWPFRLLSRKPSRLDNRPHSA